MSLTRRRSGLKKTNPYVESETPESSALGPAMTVGNLAMKGAQIHDTTMKTKVTESNILNKKVTSPSSTDVRYDVFEHTPTWMGKKCCRKNSIKSRSSRPIKILGRN